MEYIKYIQDKSEIYPFTLTRNANKLLCGGYTLEKLLSDINGQQDIEIPANTIPSITNLEKIKTGNLNNLQLFHYPWDLIVQNKIIRQKNLQYMIKNNNLQEIQKNVFIGDNVQIASSVVFDASINSPIVINNYSQISHHAYLEGPTYIGENTKIIDHASLKRVTIGDVCKIGGEVEDSIISNYTNKQHYGYIGNSYIGEWVNLGAGTTNSDLKNTYGEINISYHNQIISTGEQFLGCMIGDFSKSAINTTIYTGKIVGVNSHLFGSIKQNIPSFVNNVQSIKGFNEEFKLDVAIKIQQRMFERREKEQNTEDITILQKCFDSTRQDRVDFLK